MSFLFPANPKDGDIIVQPQPGGGFIKGTYNASDNTWAVGELPQEPGVPGPMGPAGPKGNKGDPGEGMEISGIVDSYGDLPDASDHPLQFYIVDDENKVYFSNGIQWFDQGGPIRGPQGDAGTDGTDGTDGDDGAPGNGWTGTTIVDQRPTNYQINFNSDDGLGFQTVNLLGPKGDPGELEVASATNLGGIKIGRGLNILADGTLQAGETSVDLETTPIGSDGNPNPVVLPYSPVYFEFGQWDEKSYDRQVVDGGESFGTYTSTAWVPPAGSTAAALWWWCPSYLKPLNDMKTWEGTYRAYRAYLDHTLSMSSQGGDATFFNNTSTMATTQAHNLTILVDPNTLDNRFCQDHALKSDIIEYGENVTGITFSSQIQITTGYSRVGAGKNRITLIPFKTHDAAAAFTSAFTGNVEAPGLLSNYPIETPEQLAAENTLELKLEIYELIEKIDQAVITNAANTAIVTQLTTIREALIGLRDLPGTYEDILAAYTTLFNQARPLFSYKFRFEP